jgi:nicotinate-nucleotide adenylyltransferase
MRIGIFGGSFDPVHLGHLIFAETAREQASLDRVLFIPAARPPHKLDTTLAPAADRKAMLELATGGHPAFAVSGIELDNAGISYTVETLRELSSLFPADRLVLLLGPDSIRELSTWREPLEISQRAELLTVERAVLDDAALLRKDETLLRLLGRETIEQLIERRVRMPAVGIRATDIRRRVQAGSSIRYLVPAAVAAYIASHGLYAARPPLHP